MAFEKNTATKSKNQFSARMMTEAGNMVCWTHVDRTFARKVCGVKEVHEITYAQACEYLPDLLDSDRSHVVITDTNAELELVDPANF